MTPGLTLPLVVCVVVEVCVAWLTLLVELNTWPPASAAIAVNDTTKRIASKIANTFLNLLDDSSIPYSYSYFIRFNFYRLESI
jgi:hypothetical protein